MKRFKNACLSNQNLRFKVCLFSFLFDLNVYGEMVPGGSLEIKRTSTDNVNQTHLNHVDDSYLTLSGYAQVKDQKNRLRLKLKVTDYNKYSANDTRYLEFNYRRKENEFTYYDFSLFQEKYPETSLIVNDGTSDNNGAKASFNLGNQLNESTKGYFRPSFKYKAYSGRGQRKDRMLACLLGVDYSANQKFSVIPELEVALVESSVNYYDVSSYTPAIDVSYEYLDNLELYAFYSATFSNYSKRTFTLTQGNRTTSAKEEQTLHILGAGFVYLLNDYLDLNLKFTTEENNSNNNAPSTTKEYSESTWSIGITATI